jgi:hypothetical protein
MTCIDRITTTGEIACYVQNFAAGDFPSEFAYGLSSAIAFNNMAANTPFATVAMVYRDLAPVGSADRVFFVVYDGAGNLQNFAALDRHGINFANAFTPGGPNPDPSFGTPGVTFNNHIPSNCLSCHGGMAYAFNQHVYGALFLPFDLDQFEYQDPFWSRQAQLTHFQHQNEMVWKVATRSQTTQGASVEAQLNGWYHVTTFNPDSRLQYFVNDFDSTYVPSGWAGTQAGINIYRSVIRRSCRTCHVADGPLTGGSTFLESESVFQFWADTSAYHLCRHEMPHSLQALREFWLSSAPSDLASYWDGVSPTAAATLRGCGSGDIAPLDPPPTMATLIPML